MEGIFFYQSISKATIVECLLCERSSWNVVPSSSTRNIEKNIYEDMFCSLELFPV